VNRYDIDFDPFFDRLHLVVPFHMGTYGHNAHSTSCKELSFGCSGMPETKGCAGWKQFGYNRKQQIRQCIIIPVCCLIGALIFSLI
jgi:hypothetical protein